MSKKVQVCQVSSRMLGANHRVRNQLLTPTLCARIFQKCEADIWCREKDISDLKKFLKSSYNFVPYNFNSGRFEKRISSAVKDPDKHYLDAKSRLKLDRLLRAIYSPERYRHFSNQKLINNHVLSELETVYQSNSRTKTLLRHFFVLKNKIWKWFFRPEINAKSLRTKCRGLEPKPGLEIAHKLSLFLAVKLWRNIYGDSIKTRDLRQLKHALSSKVNAYHTCIHTNRVLHVQYDNEIVTALKDKAKLSCGARMRLKQVLKVLKELDNHSDTLHRFSKHSLKLLKKI